MYHDVHDLRKFYYRSRLGMVAKRAIRDELKTFWPETQGQTIAGFGFAAPVLRPYLGSARRVLTLMPGPQGVMHWPTGQANTALLCEETRWPVQTGFVDRLIVLHGLEMSEQASALLDEAWRVLGPGGRALFIVPNRASLWARREGTPFGFGRPFTLSQLETQLGRHSFSVETHRTALFAVPSERRFWLKSSRVMERWGHKVSAIYPGGALMVEASKQVYAPRKTGLKVDMRAPLRVLEGKPAPVAGRVRHGVKSG